MQPRLSFLRAVVLTVASVSTLPAATFYVAPDGKDTQPGSQQQPLATLQAALDAARKAPEGPHRVVLMPGEYFLAKTIDLDHRDSGLTIEAQEPGKAVLYGGSPVTGWQRDGQQFWAAALPEVKAGTWDFRALVVNGRLAERARFPEKGTFLNKSEWKVPWLTSVGGGWERKPTPEELSTMPYDPKDLPATLDLRNAELRVYHMWDESLVGLAANDAQRGVLTFSTPAKSPPGAFQVKKYVVFNTREGMAHPGQWYLDRTAGRVVYWPLPGEDMARAKVIAPRLERILRVGTNKKQPVEKLTVRGLTLAATTTPLKSGGFGAYAFDGALRIEASRQAAFESLEICCVGGQGILGTGVAQGRIVGCHIHHTGACAMKVDGGDTLVGNNHVHDIGVYYPSAIALSVYSREAKGMHVFRNEVHDAPYSGIVGGGGHHVIEQNLIYRVMREMQDGGAIYGGMRDCILRGNVVRDVVKMGEGYGVSSYYLDEGARNCVVERNVSVGVERPIHMHIARNIAIRDNVFLSDGNLALSFARSSGCSFERNTLCAPGKVTLNPSVAVTQWKDNILFHDAAGKGETPQAFAIDDARPPVTPVARRTNAFLADRAKQPPKLDGDIDSDEWPGRSVGLDRAPTREAASGAPILARAAYDDQFLYVAVNLVTFDITQLRPGAAWGQDDGLEIALRGKTPDGQEATFVVRGFVGGAVQSATDAGAPAKAAESLGKSIQFCGKVYGKDRGGWRAECAIPWAAIGLKPAPGLKIPFNLSTYRSEDQVWRCWEGTQAESWRVDQGGTLQLNR